MAEDNVGRASVRPPEIETVICERDRNTTIYNSDLEETVKFVLKET